MTLDLEGGGAKNVPGQDKKALEQPRRALDREGAAPAKISAEEAKKKDEPLRSFALRAESPVAAIRRARLIAESLGGRELGTVPEKAGAAAEGEAGPSGPAAATGAGEPAGKGLQAATEKPRATTIPPTTAKEPAPSPGPAGVFAATAAPGGLGGAGAAEARTRRIVLVLPADRLDAFRRALAGWSASARGGRAAGDGKDRPGELNAQAGGALLRCDLGGAEAAELDEQDQARAYAGSALLSDQAERGAEADRGLRRKKIVVVTLTISAE